MSRCDISIAFDRPGLSYLPGETIGGVISVDVAQRCACRGLTATLEWFTHGRGNKNSKAADVTTLFAGEWGANTRPTYRFAFSAPAGPLTYHGQELNVDWRVRVRADLAWARDPNCDADLSIGPPPRGTLRVQAAAGRKLEPAAAGGSLVLLLLFSPLLYMFALLVADGVQRGLAFVALAGVAGLALFGLVFWRQVRRIVASRLARQLAVRVRQDSPGALECTISRQPERAFTVSQLSLVLVEHVVSGAGSGESTHTATIHNQVARLERRQRSDLHALVDFPKNLPASFDAPSNKVLWRLDLMLQPRYGPEVVCNLPLEARWSEENQRGASRASLPPAQSAVAPPLSPGP